MKKTMTTLIVLLFAAGALAQGTLPLHKVQGYRSFAYGGANSRYGATIWKNNAWSEWFAGMQPGYMYLDWGSMPDAGNGLPDEVVDGFQFGYATDGTAGGLRCAVYFFDDYTGWGDPTAMDEAGFMFTGLPDAAGLPPGFWGWIITVDLEDTGYEFLLAGRGSPMSGFGIGLELDDTSGTATGATLTLPPFTGGNGDTGTDDAFVGYDPNDVYLGAWWAGGYPANPYASFQSALFGGQDPALGTVYLGNGHLTGNEAGLYCTGSWSAGDSVHFMLRSNGMTGAHNLLVHSNFYWPPLYLPALDVTLVPKLPFLGQRPMSAIYAGDFRLLDINVNPGMASLTLYIQGGIGWPPGPVDLSRNIVRT